MQFGCLFVDVDFFDESEAFGVNAPENRKTQDDQIVYSHMQVKVLRLTSLLEQPTFGSLLAEHILGDFDGMTGLNFSENFSCTFLDLSRTLPGELSFSGSLLAPRVGFPAAMFHCRTRRSCLSLAGFY